MKKLLHLQFLAALLALGCSTLPREQFRTDAEVIFSAADRTYTARIKVVNVPAVQGGAEHTLSAPQVVFQAGKAAAINIGDDAEKVVIELFVPAGIEQPYCLCKTAIFRQGRLVHQENQIVKPVLK